MRLNLILVFIVLSFSIKAAVIPLLDFKVERRCIFDTTVFTDLSCCNIDKWAWDFGDPSSGSANYAYTKVAKHKYFNAGTYTVTLKVGSGGVFTDTLVKQVIICIPEKPTLIFHDSTICDGKQIVLYPIKSFDEYNWNTGDTVRTILITDSGKYILCATNCGNTCLVCDTAIIKVVPAPKPTLGQYTSTCKGDSLQLNAKNPGFKYLWSTGDTTQKIWVKKDGWYTVKIYGPKCSVLDSTYVTFGNRLTINFNTDTIGCDGDTLYLNPGWNYKQIWWNYTDTNHILKVYSSGKFPLKIYYQGCFIDTFAKVDFALPFTLNLPPDTTLCEGDTFLLDAGITGAKYLWSNGDTSKSIKVYQSDTLWIKANFHGCYQTDTFAIKFIGKPATIPTPEILTCGQPATITVSVPLGVVFKWWDGRTNLVRIFVDSGWHRYEISNSCFIIPDSVYTGFYPMKPSDGIDTTAFCLDDDTLLYLTAKTSLTYKWKPGGNGTQSIRILKYGLYSVEITDSTGCKEIDSFYVEKKCIDDTLFVPNVFSPNSDNRNDVFKPTYVRHVNYEMRIYDRWGELLFKTNDIDEGWDGKYKSRPAQEDVYIYIIEVSGYGKFRQLKGTFHLIR